MPYRSQKKSSKQLPRRVVLLVVLLVVLVVGSLLALRLRNDPGDNANNTTADSAETTTTPRPTTDKGQTEAPVPATEDPNATVNPDNLPVTKPSGSFVSNHKPGQNGSPTEESSVCLTTPGASCTITFTMNNTTKSLPAQTADSSGTAYWASWTPASVGLTAGSWKVSAVATWGTQSATTQDPVPLEVSP
jgi:hypothetical protein